VTGTKRYTDNRAQVPNVGRIIWIRAFGPDDVPLPPRPSIECVARGMENYNSQGSFQDNAMSGSNYAAHSMG
jgi:hypothetical protein